MPEIVEKFMKCEISSEWGTLQRCNAVGPSDSWN